MGNIRLKRDSELYLKKDNLELKKGNSRGKFVLSDISKEELNKRRIPVYSYLL